MNTHKKLLPVALFTITLLWACTTYALPDFGLPALNADRAAKGSVASQMIDHLNGLDNQTKTTGQGVKHD